MNALIKLARQAGNKASAIRNLAMVLLSLVIVAPSGAELGLGFHSRDLTRAERAELPEGELPGAILETVYPGSPAAAAGLLVLDRIVAVNGERVRADESLMQLIDRAKTAGAVRLTLVRGSERSEVAVVPAERRSYVGIACEAGEQAACTAIVTEGGFGLEKYAGRAAELLQTACDAGERQACMLLGYRRAKGQLGPADPAGGIALVERACEDGYPEACRLLGKWSESGTFGVLVSPERSAAYYEKGCAVGSRESCHVLGMALEDGAGVAKDLAASAAAYEEGCAREDDQACIETARMAWCCSVPRDRERGYRLYAAFCERGIQDACKRLGNLLLLDGQGLRAAALLDKNCAQGMIESCVDLGDAFQHGLAGLKPDVGRAAHLLGIACEAGHGEACFLLAYLHIAGPWYQSSGLPVNQQRAFALYSKSCHLDFMKACWHVGLSYATGDGVPFDPVRGLTLLDKACRGGEADACEWIEKLKLR